jgi:hypothetical protein
MSLNPVAEESTFRELVLAQIELLRSGDPLRAFDTFYDNDVIMFDNDRVFAMDKCTARDIQAGFINKAKAIHGEVRRYGIDVDAAISVLHNTSRFVDTDDQIIQIDGIHWQEWRNGRIVKERYFRGDMARQLIDDGVFDNPTILGEISPPK